MLVIFFSSFEIVGLRSAVLAGIQMFLMFGTFPRGFGLVSAHALPVFGQPPCPVLVHLANRTPDPAEHRKSGECLEEWR